MGLARAVLVVAGLLLAVWTAIVLLAWAFQRQLVYLPDRAAPGDPGIGVEQVTLETADGLELAAWFVPAQADAVATVLVAPGNAGSRAHRLPFAMGLAARGYDVLLLEYRGYGGNPGRPHEAGLVADARAGLVHLEGRADVAEGRIAYFGESLGTGVVAALAAEHPPAALVLRSPFPSLADVGRAHYPILPVQTLLRERFPVAEHLGRYEGPLLVLAGERDRVVPTELSRALAGAADARYVEIAGADHNDRALLDGAEFLDTIDAFLRAEAGD